MKYTVVPAFFFKEESTYDILSEAVQLSETDKVEYKELPQYKAVLIYIDTPSTTSSILTIADMIEEASRIGRYNRIVARYTAPDEDSGGRVDIVLVSGPRLLFVNSFAAQDCVTAQYYIFAALRQFQINPELTAVYLHGEVPFEMREDLFRYFPVVENL